MGSGKSPISLKFTREMNTGVINLSISFSVIVEYILEV